MNKFAYLLFLTGLLLFASSTKAFAQQKISTLMFNSTHNIVGLSFKAGTEPEVFYTGKKANSTIGEGIAHVEDEEGEITFWVTSSGVFDKENILMPGSEGIFAHPSSTEIAICPFPDNPAKYYIFYNNQLCSGLYFSVVDLSYRNGAGDVVQLNVPVSSGKDFAEGLEVIRIPCSRDYWLIANECGKGIRKFRIGKEGISDGALFGMATNDFGGRGELDYHKGKIGYAVTFKNEAYFVNFDPLTGEGSNYQTVQFPSRNGAYGLEFSPGGTKVYVTDLSNRDIFGNPTGNNLFAFDFTNGEMTAWAISNDYSECSSQMEGLGQIELGKDGNLYISQINGCQIVVVEDPESAQPTIRKINVNSTLSAGISDHVQTDFLDENFLLEAIIKAAGEVFLCSGEAIALYTEEQTENRQFQWYRDEVPLPGEQGPLIHVNEAGIYRLSISNEANCSVFSNEIAIENRRIPLFEFQEKHTGCKGERVVLATGIEDFNVTWSTGATGASISVEESGIYEFTVDNGYCSESGTIEVLLQEKSVFKIPNVITPDGDAFNEYFRISGTAEKTALWVYNRWGVLVFYATDYQNDWKGDGLSKGTYFYKIVPADGCSEQQKGWITIL